MNKLAKALAVGSIVVGAYSVWHMGGFGRAQATLGQSKNYVVAAVSTDPGEAGKKLADKISDYQGKAYDAAGLEDALTAILADPTPAVANKAADLMRPIVAKNPQYALELALEATKEGQNADYAQDIVAQTYANLPPQEKSKALHGFKADIQRDGPFQYELLSEAAERLEPEASAVIFRKSFGRLDPQRQTDEILQVYAQMQDAEQEAVLKHALKDQLADTYQAIRHTWIGAQVDKLFGTANAMAR